MTCGARAGKALLAGENCAVGRARSGPPLGPCAVVNKTSCASGGSVAIRVARGKPQEKVGRWEPLRSSTAPLPELPCWPSPQTGNRAQMTLECERTLMFLDATILIWTNVFTG